MATKTINFRVDEELKLNAENVLSEMGLNMSSALTLFLQQMVNKREIPFKIEAKDPFYSLENQLLLADRLEKYDKGIMFEKEIIEDEKE